MTQRRMIASGDKATEVRIGHILLTHQDNGSHGCGMSGISQALLETLQKRVPQCIILTAYVKVMATP